MSDPVRAPRVLAGTFEASEAVELAVAQRSGFIETRHVGSAIVLTPDGERAVALGAPDAVILPRSTLKPFQAVASSSAGARLDGEQAALATASHAGMPEHIDVVRRTLSDAGVGEEALLCPLALPADRGTRDAVLRAGGGPASIYMECSGKHAAMLAACAAGGWPIQDYTDARHPLQLHVKDVVERLTGEKVAHTAVDGCGAPVFAISLAGLARGVQRIAAASEQSPFALFRSAAFIYRSAREHPWAISGEGRPDTVLMQKLGCYAKAGADGVMTMAAADGTTVAVKVLDGSIPAARVAAVALLARVGAIDEQAAREAIPETDTAILGGGVPVGSLVPVV